MKVRRAEINDLDQLVEFTAAEAREAEGHTKETKTLKIGIKTALEEDSIAMYWVLMNQNNETVGSASALKEWSDWNAGYYWWIQSMYIRPDYRGKGYLDLLLDAIQTLGRSLRDAIAQQLFLEQLHFPCYLLPQFSVAVIDHVLQLLLELFADLLLFLIDFE